MKKSVTFIVEPREVLTEKELKRIGITIFDTKPSKEVVLDIIMDDKDYIEDTEFRVGKELILDHLDYAITIVGDYDNPKWALHRSYLNANMVNDALNGHNFYSLTLTDGGREIEVESAAYIISDDPADDINRYYEGYMNDKKFSEEDEALNQQKRRH